MSESREDSYYEVALSHRQVVWVFVVLLGCVVAAFLAGIWIGQQQEGPAVVMAESEAPDEPPQREGRELEDLNFFSEERVRPKPAIPAPGPGTTLADDLGAERTPPSAPPAGARRESPEAVSSEPQTAPPESVEMAAEPAAPSVPPPAVAPAPVAPPAGEGLVIQVFSSADRGQAEQVMERLRGSGHPAFLSPVDVEGRPMFRVRIGPFEERSRAERVAEAVRRAFRLDTWITQNS